ncbi:MAG: exodeoxyribonuclease VII large subunit [Lachnospiraceae bacterium]|uniref:Exodeoxyribonuclease 7 large subunit n=1 Tax=Candidatus Enterocloster excrementigallinarum TaxID=2838558 RepID=A0A9D2TFD9_9FIRM|nr:exodeoxyribonuclease VII large subunit [Lachnospiraceae bacterium]HJC67046.1 exodeoxyribonuclease VII large subunit [Candidatus Enterocloster excrementigallinarum]
MGNIYTVSQVNSYIKSMFAQDFALNKISVKGEISNCKYHPSGHIYFTLKDGGSQIGAVMFSSQRLNLKFRLEEGQQVVVQGTIDVYERDGRYQLYARQITREGTGDLYLRFEQLKQELEEMGMFDGSYKQPIPKYARRVGIVTASTGAAIRDIMNISARRNPYVQLVLYPALVQGTEAKYSIVRGIETLDAMGLDVIIVGRGGGSIEDLWAFNEEMVARAIFNCSTPIISAVGHETDVTIADYVADLRAPTPSAAAELAVFDYSQFEAKCQLYQRTLERTMKNRLERVRYRLNQCRLKLELYHPSRVINEKRQRLADLESRLTRVMSKRLEAYRHRLALDSGRLQALSPLAQLGRGYSFVTGRDGKRLDSVKQAAKGDQLRIELRDGTIVAKAEQISHREGVKST